MIPEGWQTYKLNKITSRIGDGLHGTPIYDEDGEYYFINGSNLVDGKIAVNSNTKKVSENEYNKYKKELSDKTILIGINGTIGNIAVYNNEKCILGKSAAYLNVNKYVDKVFLKYVLLNSHFQNYIKTNATGTTIKNVGLALLREYEFDAPKSIRVQQLIASILSSLDDKIELNLQMNKTLEAIAQAIFKEWFVDFRFPGFSGELVDVVNADRSVSRLPKGWRKGKLGDIVDLRYGKALKSENRVTGRYPVVGSSGIVGFHNESLVKAPGIVIGRKGTIGEVIWIDEEFYPIDTTFYIKDQVGVNELYFHYYLLLNQDFKRIGSDSAVPGLNRNQALLNSVICPDIKSIQSFNSLIKPIFEKKYLNKQGIKTIILTKDSLLPKLMTGKIRVA